MQLRKNALRNLTGTAATLTIAFACTQALALEVANPDEICAPGSDPCIVDQFLVLTGFDYDFGTREVRIVKGGSIKPTRGGIRDVLCGAFTLERGGNINLRPMPFEFGAGGRVRIQARGVCSDNPLSVCLRQADCPAGSCVGGNVALDGRIRGQALEPGTFEVLTPGNISSTGKHDMSHRGRYVIGAGEIELRADGMLAVTGDIRLRGGQGGFLTLVGLQQVDLRDAKVDLTAASFVSASSGLTIESSFDVFASGSVRAKPDGRFSIAAGRDAFVTSQSDGSPTKLDLRGGRDNQDYPGRLIVEAARDAAITAAVEIDLTGNGYRAGSVSVAAGRDIVFGSVVKSSGEISLGALGGSLVVSNTARFVVDSKASGWAKNFAAGTLLDFSGSLEARSDAFPGTISLEADTLAMAGSFLQRGGAASTVAEPSISLRACDLQMLPGASISTQIETSDVRFESGTIAIGAGSALNATLSSSIYLLYSDSVNPPIVSGAVSPAPTITFDSTAGTCD